VRAFYRIKKFIILFIVKMTSPFLMPVYLLLRVYLGSGRKLKDTGKRFVLLLVTLFVAFPFYILFYIALFTLFDNMILNRYSYVPLSGTGSMYPTFPKSDKDSPEEQALETVASPKMFHYPNGITVTGNRYFVHELVRGDIVSFTNEATVDVISAKNGSSTGFVKRIIGAPGDVIELRDGLVYINGFPIDEPYTALPRSTFGGKFLTECTPLEIPQNKYFVMGDNRKSSNDSRFQIGLVDYHDIDLVIPMQKQIGIWDVNWRDTGMDLSESSRIQFNEIAFVRVVNEERAKRGLESLSRDSRLDTSARLRAENILRYNDFSFEGEISGYSMRRALSDAGYTNITWGEIPVQGYYTEEELIEYIFEFPESLDFILNKDFQDIGISVFVGELEGCPTQLIVFHLGGYSPPDYSSDMVSSWKNLLQNLLEIQPGWAELKNYPNFYEPNKKEVDKINEIIEIRIRNVRSIVEAFEANRWLTKNQEDYIARDDELHKEQSELADYLNSRMR
jgi:signal peptidase I